MQQHLCVGGILKENHFHKGGDLRDITHVVNLAICTTFRRKANLLSD